MSSITVFMDAVVTWFKSWRSTKAGAELKAGQECVDETDTAAAEIVAELKKKHDPK